LEIFHTKKQNDSTAAKDTLKLKTLYQRIATQMNRIALDSLDIEQMNITVHTRDETKKEKVNHFNNVNIFLKDILIDSTTQYDSTRFLYAKDANIQLRQLEFKTKDSLYSIRLDSVAIHAAEKSLLVKNFFAVKARYNKTDFPKQQSFIKRTLRCGFRHCAL